MRKGETARPEKCLAILGTASDVGKSIVVTALCRIASNRGLSVAPFKAQNMSNNSFVTPEGGEIGRAQVAQAEAARLTPHVDMNPVLLKPSSDLGAQVVLRGRPLKESSAKEYGRMTDALRKKATSGLERLRKAHDFVIMEGAGSCAEVNLRHRDIVNFAMAAIADAPVLLVADIDRGGVFAQVVGTLEIVAPEERARVKGVLINRFRGDRSLLKELRPDPADAIEDSSDETAFQHRDGKYDRLADWFNAHVDINAIFDIAGCGRGRP